MSVFRTPLLQMSALVLLSEPAAALDTDWQQQALAAAVKFHQAHLPETCEPLSAPLVSPLSFELQIGEETAARQALMVQLPCRRTEEGESSVFLASDQNGIVTRQSFPKPVYESGEVTTFREELEVYNATFDASSRSVVERIPLPDNGGTNITTSWGYRDGRFHIMRFSVDATADDEDNPRILIDKDIW
ncbi:MAG: hypothetical protein ACK4P4_01735 [Allorhizobium sp.]